ncbi:MAG: DUF441 domain-containing protein [Firmicutes bacterium]|nr:DUF441 domain-containing protein [Bacillota bacterium]
MFTTEDVVLLVFLLLGLAARSNLVAAAATILLMLRFTHLTFVLPVLERRGVEVGLLFLTLAMLVPFALGKISLKEVGKSFLTLPGILALIGGAVATHLNGRGLEMLNQQSHLMFALIVGSIIGIVVWGGMPVGPLMAAGVTYVLLVVVTFVSQWWK